MWFYPIALCSSGCGKEETIDHLFLKCEFFGSIWHLLHPWLGISTTIPSYMGCHAQQYFGAHAFKKEVCSCFRVVWMTCLWVIWKERNSRIFNNKAPSQDHLLDSIKLHSWWWLKAPKSSFYFNFRCWYSSLSLCIEYYHCVIVVLGSALFVVFRALGFSSF